MRRAFVAFPGCVVALALVPACSSDAAPAARDGSNIPAVRGSITVSAASSLGPVLEQMRRRFSALHPNASVRMNLGSSTALVTQIEQGAGADVFASADPELARRLADAGRLIGAPQVFAHNQLTIVTKRGNPKGVRSVADLTQAGVIALCVQTAPCGSYAARVLQRSGVAVAETSVTRQPDAATTIGAVANGDADAAIVYTTDARTAGDTVATVAIPAAANVVATYPLAILKRTSAPKVAAAFVAYLQSADGQRILRSFGFLPV